MGNSRKDALRKQKIPRKGTQSGYQAYRGKGLGKQLMQKAIELSEGGKTGLGHSPAPCLMPVMSWQCVVAILEGALYFREHCS